MILLLIVALLAFAIIGVATAGNNKGDYNDFEAKYSKHNLKIVSGDYPCCDCSYFYDGKIDSYPFVPNEERPHPPCCRNKHRCLEDKSKCYIHDNL